MISLDSSIVAAFVIFLATVVALNHLLFQPLLRVHAERESRTTGLVSEARKRLDHQTALFGQYEATVKQARIEAYQRQEQSRTDALSRRAAVLEEARQKAELLLQESRAALQRQVAEARAQLDREADEISRTIAAIVLQRSA